TRIPAAGTSRTASTSTCPCRPPRRSSSASSLEVTNNGGHSSLPVKDNAIYHLADGLSRLSKFDFPVRLFDVTRAAFERSANIYGGQLGADLNTMVQNPADAAAVARLSAIPFYNSQMRTTC